MFKTKQTEDFKVPNNVIYNLLPDEKLYFKLKVQYFSKKHVLMLIMSLITFIICLIFFPSLIFFKKYIIVTISILIIFPICFIYFLMVRSFTFLIFITNKKIFFIRIKPSIEYRADIVELSYLKGIFAHYKDKNKDVGKIEFLYKSLIENEAKYKEKKIVTPLINKISKIVQIIESIISYHESIEKGLNNIENLEKFINLKDINQDLNLEREKIRLEFKFELKTSLENLKPYLELLNEDEKIMFLFFRKKGKEIMKSFIFLLLSFTYFYFLMFSFVDFSIVSFTIFIGICLIFVPFPITILSQKYIKYIFTTERVMLDNSKQIISIPYNNFLAITYHNNIINQNIEIHFLNPVKCFNIDQSIKIEINSPKKFDLFTRILNLSKNRNQKTNLNEN